MLVSLLTICSVRLAAENTLHVWRIFGQNIRNRSCFRRLSLAVYCTRAEPDETTSIRAPPDVAEVLRLYGGEQRGTESVACSVCRGRLYVIDCNISMIDPVVGGAAWRLNGERQPH